FEIAQTVPLPQRAGCQEGLDLLAEGAFLPAGQEQLAAVQERIARQGHLQRLPGPLVTARQGRRQALAVVEEAAGQEAYHPLDRPLAQLESRQMASTAQERPQGQGGQVRRYLHGGWLVRNKGCRERPPCRSNALERDASTDRHGGRSLQSWTAL